MLWNMKVTILKDLIRGLGMLEIGGRAEIIQTTSLLRSAGILRKSWRPKVTYGNSDSSVRPSGNAGVKNSPGVML